MLLQQISRYLLIHDFATDLDQPAVSHTGRAGGFTGAAGKATVKMGLCSGADLVAFQHLLDQVDATARPVQLIAKQLVGWAGGCTETAVYAGAQNRLCILDVRVAQKLFADVGLHELQIRVQLAGV